MKKLLCAAAILTIMSASAHAATLDVTLGNTNVSPLSFGSGAALSPNINLSVPSPASLSLDFNSFIVNSTTAQHTTPTGVLFGGNYLAVIGDGGAGSATFTLAANQNNFAFTWGTIDHYNSLILTDSRNVVYTITGSDILNHILGSVDGSTQSDVNFFDPFGQIVKAQLTSTTNAFEAANFSQSTSAPLPPSMILFATALLALGFFAHRRKQAKI